MQKKGGKGITAIRFKLKAGGGGKLARSEGKGKSEADAVSCMRVCRAGDEVVLSTSKGNKNISNSDKSNPPIISPVCHLPHITTCPNCCPRDRDSPERGRAHRAVSPGHGRPHPEDRQG